MTSTVISPSLATVAYLAATILFILCLGGLSNQETSRRGNLYGMVGMAIAVLATIFGPRVTPAGYAYILAAMVVGAAIGLYAARIVQMTQMPELVALMHSLVGLAACLVGYANFIDPAVSSQLTPAEYGKLGQRSEGARAGEARPPMPVACVSTALSFAELLPFWGSRHADVAPAAVTRASRRDHHRVATVRQQMHLRRGVVRRVQAADIGWRYILDPRGRMHFLHPRVDHRNVAWSALLQQQLGGLHARLRVKPAAHDPVQQHVRDGDDRHALVMGHVRAHDDEARVVG